MTADLSSANRDARAEAELAQGELIARGNESAWGWSGAAGTKRAERRADFLIEQARLRPGVRCLEIGAGTGEFTVRIADAGCEVVALELSPTTAEVCRERTRGRASVVIGNIETGEGLAGQTFQAVVGVSVLHHVNLDACLDQIVRVLEPGGRVAFSEPNMANPQIWLERHVGVIKAWRHVTPHETAFRTGQLRKAFERLGFVVDVCEPFDFLHPSTPGRLVSRVAKFGERLERTPLGRVAGSIRIAGGKP